MLCKKPYMIGALPCGCGQCLPCRINRRRLWVHRMVLESAMHVGSCFVTLTYDEKNLPNGGNLEPTHSQKWLKRLRKELSPEKIRYFLVGEYGDESQRPHYHAAIFGLDPIHTQSFDSTSELINKTWGKGHTMVGTLTMESASYIAGYVTKKLTNKNDPYVSKKLAGRNPEFARMSLGGRTKSGGIGALAVGNIAAAYGDSAALDSIVDNFDVGSTLLHGRARYPLGRYLKSKLRKALGYGEKLCTDAFLAAQLKMQVLQKMDAEAAAKINQNVFDIQKQKILNLESKAAIKGMKSL